MRNAKNAEISFTQRGGGIVPVSPPPPPTTRQPGTVEG